MPFTTRNYNHLDLSQFSAGPTTSFMENFEVGFRRQREIDSMLGFESELLERYNNTLERAAEITGENFGADVSAGLDVMGAAARNRLSGETNGRLPSFITERYLQQFNTVEKKLNQLRENYPELKTFDEIMQEVVRERKELYEESEDVFNRARAPGWIGGFLGGMAGSFDPQRDPLLVGSLFLPLVGRTLASKVVAEAAIGGGTETLQQFGFVQPTQDLLEEDGTDPLTSVLFATLGAGALRGAFEGAAPAFRAVEQRVAPNRAAARVIRDTIEQDVRQPLSLLQSRLRMSDEELLTAVRSLPETPTSRAAAASLEETISLRNENPIGTDRHSLVAVQRAIELERAQFNGTDTAVDRFIDAPQELPEESLERFMTRNEFPELYKEMDEAKIRLDNVEREIGDLENTLSTRTVADAIQHIDKPSAARVREIENELDEAIPRPRRDALEEELNQVVESIGPREIEEAERQFRIGLERQLRDRRKARKSHQRSYKRLRKQADKLEAQQAAPRQTTANTAASDAIAAQRTVEDFEKSFEPHLENVVARQDYGASDSFEVPIDETGAVRTVAQINEDLLDDDALLAAAKECAL